MKEPTLRQFPQSENIKPNNEVYDKASLIIQTTNQCSKNCPACYLA